MPDCFLRLLTSSMVEHEPVTLRGFLGTWEMMVYHNWRQAFKYLCYLGIREESFNYLDVLPFRCVLLNSTSFLLLVTEPVFLPTSWVHASLARYV